MSIKTAVSMKENSTKLYEMLGARQAPAVGGAATKGVFEDDLRLVKSVTGCQSWDQLFGAKALDDNAPFKRNLNFGSKADTGMIPDDVRLRLFGLKKLISSCEIQAQLATRNLNPSAAEIMATPLYKQALEPMLKAFNVTDFSTFIQTVNARFFFEEYEIPLLVGDLFDQLPMESSSINAPGALGRLMGQLETDAGSFTAQSNTQSNASILAKNNVVHTQITEDLNQDSAPAVIDKLRKEVVLGVGRAEERSYLDGDVTGSHMDADVTDAKDFRKAFKGIRKAGLANSANDVVIDNGGDAVSKATFQELLRALGKFASEKAMCAWIVGSTVANDLVTGAIPELFTAFAFGGPASNRTGDMPPVFGINPVQSEWVREDLADTGVYTIAAQTKTWMALVRKDRMLRYLRQPIRVWAAPSLPSSDLMLMSGKKRQSFFIIPQTADEKSIAIAINIETAS